MNDTKVNDPAMNPRDNTKVLTWEDLKEFVNKLTPEQLKTKLMWEGDDRGGRVSKLSTFDEDYYETDEGLETASCVDFDGSYVIGFPKGSPFIEVD